MSILPQGEELRKAVKWISDKKQYESETDLNKLIQQAGLKFNLSPKDEAYLERFINEG
ncbi:hypothetical protein QUF90_20160 [Desulfococcaceae bacterium HSG9]|nr:hypothetical protein [Desulfococcaceae bacterium HSG9]